MANDGSSPLIARFDRFEVDVRSCDLSKAGKAIVIQKQPFQVLCLLLKAEGEVVTREQLRSILWPEDTFVDFEHGVNTAVKKVRQALKDSAERPRFIETLPKVGYRFIVPVEWVNGNNGKGDLPPVEPEDQALTLRPSDENVDYSKKSKVRHLWWKIAMPALLVVVCAAAAVWYTKRPLPVPHVVAYTQITHDGHQKVVAGTDGTRIYFTGLSPNFIAQVAITGGEIVPMPIPDVREALELCFNLRGDWKLTKFEMVDDILDGGFRGNTPESNRRILRDSINDRLKRGQYLEKNGLIGRNPHAPKRKNAATE